MGQTGRLAIHFAVGMEFTREVEQHPVGMFGYRAFERRNDRILLTEGPRVGIADSCHAKRSKPHPRMQKILDKDENSIFRFFTARAGKPLAASPSAESLTEPQKAWK
jgi:hypothetical protein